MVLEEEPVIYGNLKAVVFDAFERAKRGQLHGIFFTESGSVPYAYVIKSALRELLENEFGREEAGKRMPYFVLMNPRERRTGSLEKHIQNHLGEIIRMRNPETLKIMVFDESHPRAMIQYGEKTTAQHAAEMIEIAYAEMRTGTKIRVIPTGVNDYGHGFGIYNPLASRKVLAWFSPDKISKLNRFSKKVFEYNQEFGGGKELVASFKKVFRDSSVTTRDTAKLREAGRKLANEIISVNRK